MSVEQEGPKGGLENAVKRQQEHQNLKPSLAFRYTLSSEEKKNASADEDGAIASLSDLDLVYHQSLSAPSTRLLVKKRNLLADAEAAPRI